MSNYRVDVFDNKTGKKVGTVGYNQNLDYWENGNYQNGGAGLHKGLSQINEDQFILIHGNDLQGRKDYGEIISKERAISEINKSGNFELFKKFNFED